MICLTMFGSLFFKWFCFGISLAIQRLENVSHFCKVYFNILYTVSNLIKFEPKFIINTVNTGIIFYFICRKNEHGKVIRNLWSEFCQFEAVS